MRLNSFTAGKWIGSVASFLAALAGIGCPLCIPALVAFASSIGLGFALNAPFVHGIVIAFLGLTLASLLWAAKLHGHWWIVFSGLAASFLVYTGRFISFAPALIWTGAILLIATSLVNFHLKRGCPNCRKHAR